MRCARTREHAAESPVGEILQCLRVTDLLHGEDIRNSRRIVSANP
jgi:hypothetical protein